MTRVSKSPTTIELFAQTTYMAEPKNVLIWDTCCLLDILRFPYRNGNLQLLQELIEVRKLIEDDEIYSICSDLTQTEWDTNELIVKSDLQKSLRLTSKYHADCVDIINHLFTSSFPTTVLFDKGLTEELEHIAYSILNKTIFLETDSIAQRALDRVRHKKPPGSKKSEFKDCAIWETALEFASKTSYASKKVIFFTVNSEDFMDKSRTPHTPYSVIQAEAITYGIVFTSTITDALAAVK